MKIIISNSNDWYKVGQTYFVLECLTCYIVLGVNWVISKNDAVIVV